MKVTKEDGLTIIGIGSSAGGLEAIRELVSTLPKDLSASYIVVQHMSPHHKSLMTELVARQTELKVQDVADGISPEPNVIYITPPKTDVVFENKVLRLKSPSDHPASPKPSVDRFLTSLAENHGDKSMAIILSGTGSDGAYGVQAVREAGGITIAQDGESSKYDGMPQSAVQTGCVDLVLRPMDIGTHLQKILSSKRDFSFFRSEAMNESPFSDLLHVLLARTRVDFRDYKQATVHRRIERRMVALGIDDLDEYIRFCRNNPAAVDALFKDLLISVTRFFRDKEAFEQLETMLPKLLKDAEGRTLRVWVAGCATGEEAYSIAMLLAEKFESTEGELRSKFQIFATDIDKAALNKARKGVYGNSALNSIPEALADKYLVHVSDGVRVVESVRQTVLFSDHNVCQDPPFQKVDLICCRNLLIYFGHGLQQKVMSRFYYAMNENALMFLGTAEGIAGSDSLFAAKGGSSHIFGKRVLSKDKPLVYNMPNIATPRSAAAKGRLSDAGPSADRQFFEALAQSLGRNSLLVGEDYSITRIYGNITPYIDLGEETGLKMHLDLLRSPLRQEARSLVTIALKNGLHRSGVRHLLAEEDQDEVRLDVYPIIAKDINEKAALVVITKVDRDRSRDVARAFLANSDNSLAAERIISLENEVATTREALQQTIEELETSNEELQSLNEELQSTNEELQATNEELETSNEELQSTNEELITVNEELQVTTSELTGRTGELASVLQSTPLAILVTDNALQVTQATDSAAILFGIKQPISNPHISQCQLPDGYPLLAPICNDTLKLGQAEVREFNANGTRVRISLSPYFDKNGQVLGLTLVVSEFPGLAREMEAILDLPHLYLMHRLEDGTIVRISRKSAEQLNIAAEDAIGMNIRDLTDKEGAETILQADQAFLQSGKDSEIGEVRFKTPHMQEAKHLNLTRFKYSIEDGENPSVYSVGSDITETVRAKDEAHKLISQVQVLQELADVGYWQVDVQNETVFWSTPVYDLHGVTPATHKPTLESGLNFYHPDDVEAVTAQVSDVIENGGEFKFSKRIIRADGAIIKVASHGVAVQNASGEIVKIAGIIRAE